MERLYSTTEAGKLLGGLHRNGVLLLIAQGQLKAKTQCVRGTGTKPRRYITASEIERYIRELPDAEYEIAKPLTPAKRRRAPTGLREEIRKATQYC